MNNDTKGIKVIKLEQKNWTEPSQFNKKTQNHIAGEREVSINERSKQPQKKRIMEDENQTKKIKITLGTFHKTTLLTSCTLTVCQNASGGKEQGKKPNTRRATFSKFSKTNIRESIT